MTEEEKIAEFIRTRGVDRVKTGVRALGHMRERDWQAIAQGEAAIVRGNPQKTSRKASAPGAPGEDRRSIRDFTMGGKAQKQPLHLTPGSSSRLLKIGRSVGRSYEKRARPHMARA